VPADLLLLSRIAQSRSAETVEIMRNPVEMASVRWPVGLKTHRVWSDPRRVFDKAVQPSDDPLDAFGLLLELHA
jgi:hypothetical protein